MEVWQGARMTAQDGLPQLCHSFDWKLLERQMHGEQLAAEDMHKLTLPRPLLKG